MAFSLSSAFLRNQSISLGLNPLYLMLPAAIACSFAFMLPVATPPNAIAFAHGNLSVLDMVSVFHHL